ncbi:MAG: hypothetical protein JOZ13_10570 [Alphaproteobacteria bacterium]|nr:hypothetical protein [Alphaproteobacteria bacterium]
MDLTVGRADLVHLGLMLGALAVAYLLPFELLLIAYIVLGPAHYYTEISWLHDRKYFMPHRASAIVLALAALGGMFIADPYWSGVLVWSCLLGAGIAALGLTSQKTAMLATVATALTLMMALASAPFLLIGVLLPTFIHVSLFTLMFMTLAALRTRSAAQFALIGVYVLSVAAILIVPPTARSVVPAFARLGEYYFGPVATALGNVFAVPDLEFAGRIAGLLSFVYTYHYLNWFIKADVIRWSKMPRPRLAAVAALSLASTAFCFYNYTLGITVLLLVSLMHVLLEFPLNTIAMRELAGLALRRRTVLRSA